MLIFAQIFKACLELLLWWPPWCCLLISKAPYSLRRRVKDVIRLLSIKLMQMDAWQGFLGGKGWHLFCYAICGTHYSIHLFHFKLQHVRSACHRSQKLMSASWKGLVHLICIRFSTKYLSLSWVKIWNVPYRGALSEAQRLVLLFLHFCILLDLFINYLKRILSPLPLLNLKWGDHKLWNVIASNQAIWVLRWRRYKEDTRDILIIWGSVDSSLWMSYVLGWVAEPMEI